MRDLSISRAQHRGQRGKGSFRMRTGIYLAPERGGANLCGTMGRDIGGQQLQAELPERRVRPGTLNRYAIGLCLWD